MSPSEKTDRTLGDLKARFITNPGLRSFLVIPFSKDNLYNLLDDIQDTSYKVIDML